MIDQYFRAKLPRIVGPAINVLSKLGVTPNQLTWSGFFIAMGAAVAVARNWSAFGLILWWLSRLIDGLDGILARHLGVNSLLGGYLDIVLDMLAYSLMVLAFSVLYPELSSIWMLILVGYVGCITSALAYGNLAQSLNKPNMDNRSLRLGAGLAEAGETSLAYSVFLIFPNFIGYTSLAWLLILAITVVARTLMAYRDGQASIKEPASENSVPGKPTHGPQF